MNADLIEYSLYINIRQTSAKPTFLATYTFLRRGASIICGFQELDAESVKIVRDDDVRKIVNILSTLPSKGIANRRTPPN